jgi:GMP reductase
MRDLFSYDDICLRPNYSELETRRNADTSICLFPIVRDATRNVVDYDMFRFKLPVVPANMRDVISWDIASSLQTNDYFYIMHRFENSNLNIPQHIREGIRDCRLMSISLGVDDASKKEFDHMLENGWFPNMITIDVAHGHHKKVADMIKWLAPNSPKTPHIIAGNVATADGYKFLCDLGVDAVKVGIGGGSICSTRYKTGFHVPTAYSVWDCATNGDRDIPIIADGGAKHFGDIAKALVLGADMVMSGKWFAECIDSPAQIIHGKKVYRGSTSYEAKGHKNNIEGHSIEIEEGCTYAERLVEIQQALSSAISYAGGKDLSAFNSVEWDLLSQ